MKSPTMRIALLASAAASEEFSNSSTPELTRQDRIRGAFFGALVADALTLGSHYEYDAEAIKRAYGGKPINQFLAPGDRMGGSTHGVGWGRRNYHPGQKAGDQTDYGEYNVLMLEYFANVRSQAENKSEAPMSIKQL